MAESPSTLSGQGPEVTPQFVRAVLALSDERDRYLARIEAAEREGYALGYRDGYEQAHAELEGRRGWFA